MREGTAYLWGEILRFSMAQIRTANYGSIAQAIDIFIQSWIFRNQVFAV